MEKAFNENCEELDRFPKAYCSDNYGATDQQKIANFCQQHKNVVIIKDSDGGAVCYACTEKEFKSTLGLSMTPD